MKGTVCTVILLFLLNLCPGQNTIFWSVKDTVSGHQSYLLGTYHQMGNHFPDSLTLVMEKLKETERGIFESLSTPEGTARMINRREPSDQWSEDLKRRSVKFLEAYTDSWAVDIDKVRPSELLIKLQQDYARYRCGNVIQEDKHDHFDNYLIAVRDSLGLKNIGLETDSIQTELISRDFKEASWKDLRKKINKWTKLLDRKKVNKDQCSLSKLYRSMKIDYSLEKDCPESVIIKERNHTWMEKLPDMLRQNDSFIAVGLFHLFFDCGLVSALRDNGFVVEPVYDLAPKDL